jgi:hypothetical protein
MTMEQADNVAVQCYDIKFFFVAEVIFISKIYQQLFAVIM